MLIKFSQDYRLWRKGDELDVAEGAASQYEWLGVAKRLRLPETASQTTGPEVAVRHISTTGPPRKRQRRRTKHATT